MFIVFRKERLEAELDALRTKWMERMEQSLRTVADESAARLSRDSERIQQMNKAFAETTAEAEARLSSLRKALNQQDDRFQQALVELQATERRIGTQTAKLAEATTEVEDKLSRLREYLNQLSRRQQDADQRLNEHVARIDILTQAARQNLEQRATALLETASQEIERLSSQLKIESRSAVGSADEMLQNVENVVAATKESLHGALESFSRTSQTLFANAERQFQESCRATAAKWVEDIADKANDATCTTFEALSQASAWYKKRLLAETETMLQRGFQQATGDLGAKSEAAYRDFGDTIERIADQSVEAHGKHLQEITNASLQSAVNTFNQKSEEQLEALVRSAEQRLRQICNEVFTEVGENLRRSLVEPKPSRPATAGQS